MTYFIFDMDETLAELYSVYYFLVTLTAVNDPIISKHLENDFIKSDFIKDVNKAYWNFVKGVVREEASAPALTLGVLRPGLLSVMVKLNRLYKRGKIKGVIIYSNNGHLESLQFIRDLIHTYLGVNGLIKDCIHWDHPMREGERNSARNKTWAILKNIMVSGPCNAISNLEPSQVFFFDDLDHPDLQEALGPNYYKVPAYDFKASFELLKEIYMISLINSRVDIRIFSNYISQLIASTNRDRYVLERGTLDAVIDVLKYKTRDTADVDERPPLAETDEGIQMMNDAIRRVITAGRNQGIKGGLMRGGMRTKCPCSKGKRRTLKTRGEGKKN